MTSLLKFSIVLVFKSAIGRNLKTKGRCRMSSGMTVKIEKGNLVITMPMTDPTPSVSGKTLVVASTHGNTPTTATVDGKPVIIGLNAYIRNR